MSMAHFISNMNLLESMKMQRLILFWNTGISLANCKTKNIQLLYLNAVPCHVNNFFLNILLKSAWHCDVRLQNYGAVIFVLLLGSPCSLSRTVSILGLYPKHRNLCFGIASAVSHFVIFCNIVLYQKHQCIYCLTVAGWAVSGISVIAGTRKSSGEVAAAGVSATSCTSGGALIHICNSINILVYQKPDPLNLRIGLFAKNIKV